jgi:hypothetical protein
MNQKVVAKIFNPYGKGRWYLMNSDPADPDYLWGIVQMGSEVEIGSISRRELENIRFSAWRLPLERDLSFSPKDATIIYDGLKAGKIFKKGGFVEKEANKDMLLNYAQEFKHHSTEFAKAAKQSKQVMPWVIAKAERASTDLSDITHYLDGENSKYAEGGITNGYYDTMAKGGATDGKLSEVMADAKSISANQKTKTYVFDYEFDRYSGNLNSPNQRYTWGYQDDVDYNKEKGFDSFIKVIATYDNGVQGMAEGGATSQFGDFYSWSDKEVKKKFGSSFQEGFPMVQFVRNTNNEEVQNASGVLKNGKSIVFNVDTIEWEVDDKMADGGMTDEIDMAKVESSAQYYADTIINALNTLGYNLSLCNVQN